MAPAALESNSGAVEASSLASASTSSTRARCSGGPGNVFLANFSTATGASSLFYVGAEGESVPATIGIRPGDCYVGGADGKGTYATADGTARAGSDYTETSGTTPVMCDDLHRPEPLYCDEEKPRSHTVRIPLLNDSQAEAAVESFEFEITHGTNGVDPRRFPCM